MLQAYGAVAVNCHRTYCLVNCLNAANKLSCGSAPGVALLLELARQLTALFKDSQRCVQVIVAFTSGHNEGVPTH